MIVIELVVKWGGRELWDCKVDEVHCARSRVHEQMCTFNVTDSKMTSVVKARRGGTEFESKCSDVFEGTQGEASRSGRYSADDRESLASVARASLSRLLRVLQHGPVPAPP